MGDAKGGSLSGRRRVRKDAEALGATVPGYTVIRLGPMYLKIVLDMITEFVRGGGVPISQGKRDEIIARYTSKSPGSVIMGQLRSKGAFEAVGSGATHPVDVVPRQLGVIYVHSRTRTIAWPREHAGKTLDDLRIESGAARSAPAASSSTPLVKRGEPVVCGKMASLYYEAVMEAARACGYAPMSVVQLGKVYQRVNPETHDLPAVTYRLEQPGFLQMVSGTKMAGTAMRVVVFQPYRIRFSRSRIGEVIVPPELEDKTASDPDPTVQVSAAPPALETVEEEPVVQAPTEPEPEPSPASSTDGLLAKVRERRAQLDQAEQDIDLLVREKAERERLVVELEEIKDKIVALNGSITARSARLAALGITL